MFERFTKEARAVVTGAQGVARAAGSRSIDTRHLLLPLIETPGRVPQALRDAGADVAALATRARADLRAGGIDGDALAGIGIDLDAVRRQAEAVFGPDALERAAHTPKGHIPFTSDAKKALELSLREAIRLHQKSIVSSHLLLGIVRGDSPGRALLIGAGVDIAALRRALDAGAQAA